MAQIILTILGPWATDPHLTADHLTLTYGDPDAELAEEIAEIAAPIQGFEPSELSALKAHAGVLTVTGEVSPGDLNPAKAAARLMLQAFATGALAAYVETAGKVFAPTAVQGIDPEHLPTLFHLLVEVYRDPNQAVTEGMQAFGLRDIQVPFNEPEAAGPAQAAAFSLAAKMVCDGIHPADGHPFRASESAPLYRIKANAAPEDDGAFHPNSLGFWRLA